MAKTEPFEKWTAEYDHWFKKNDLVYFSELNAIKTLLPHSGNGLEIGTGTGRFAGPLGIKLGLEPSAQMRKLARQRGLQVVTGVAEELPFADTQFDFALMVTTICFLDDIDASFYEVNRVLKPSGHFIIGFIDKNSPLGKQYEKNKKDNRFYRFATFYSVDKIVSLLKKTGFVNPNFVQTIFHPLNEICEIEAVMEGYGQGSFIVISAEKNE